MSKKVLHVYLFGVMSIEKDGQNIPLPSSVVARRLLAYFLFNKDRPHTRAVLAGIFWGEMPETRARKALSQALWHIRQNLSQEPSCGIWSKPLCDSECNIPHAIVFYNPCLHYKRRQRILPSTG